MACCFLFCSDEPVDNDKYGAHPNFFQVKLKDAACRDPGCCMPACILWPCALYKTRTLVLDEDMKLYMCCQDYYHPCTKHCNGAEKDCPQFCLCLEVVICPSCSISASRMVVMDQYMIQSDPWDAKIIRLNNMLQFLSIFCDILAIFNNDFRDASMLLDCMAEISYCTIQACMVTQVHIEKQHRGGGGNGAKAGFEEVPVAEARPYEADEAEAIRRSLADPGKDRADMNRT